MPQRSYWSVAKPVNFTMANAHLSSKSGEIPVITETRSSFPSPRADATCFSDGRSGRAAPHVAAWFLQLVTSNTNFAKAGNGVIFLKY
jgi:hypothetical protein